MPNTLSVRQERDPSTEKDNAEQKADRKAQIGIVQKQLNTAIRLNNVTLISGIISLVALVAVWYGLYLTRQHFHLDQRPWAMVSAIEEPKQVPDGRVAIPVYFADFGKSPAINTVVRSDVFLGEDAMEHADQFFTAMDDPKLRIERSGSRFTIAPGAPSEPTKAPDFTTASTRGPISPDSFAEPKTQYMRIIVATRVDYEDTAGQTYHTEFCAGLLATGAMNRCATHNKAF